MQGQMGGVRVARAHLDVYGCGGFVKDEDVRGGQHGAGDGDKLPLALG